MARRHVAAVLAFTTIAGCAAPRAGMVAGALTTLTGALVFQSDHAPAESVDPVPSIGMLVVVIGLGLFVWSAAGMTMEPDARGTAGAADASQHPVVERAAGPAGTSSAERPELAPPGSAAAELAARREQLTTQVWLESRAGHCRAATAAARRLAVLDRGRLVALVDRNPVVAGCVAYRM